MTMNEMNYATPYNDSFIPCDSRLEQLSILVLLYQLSKTTPTSRHQNITSIVSYFVSIIRQCLSD
jgi:hypothetical protein